jgi:hypothetical protein
MIRKPAFHVIWITFLLLLLGWYLASFETFFSVDTGLRFMQVRQLVEHGWRTFAIDYPQQFLDPNLEHVPYYYAYSVIGGDIYFNVSHIYPFLVSIFYGLLGWMGLPVVAIAGGVLTAVAIYKLSKLTRLPRPQIILWVVIFATPILFYSLALWDHTLAAACAAWAVYGVSKALAEGRWQPAFWGGVAAGFGLAQRPEMYLFTLALGLGVLVFSWRKWRLLLAFVLGGVISTFIVWGVQYYWVGHPFGLAFAPHFFGYGAPSQYTVESKGFPTLYKFTFMLFYVEPGILLTFAATLLILVGILLIVFSLRLEQMRKPGWLMAGGITCIAGYILLMYWARYGIIPGIISTFPLIPLSITMVDGQNGRDRRIHHFVFLVTLLFLGGMVLIWPAYGGRQWGARYLLPAYPLFAYLAYYTYVTLQSQLQNDMQKTLRRVTAALLVISVLLQFMGVRALYGVRKEKAYQRDLVASLAPDLLIADKTQMHVPPAMSTLTGKLFLQTGDEANQQALFSNLQEARIPQFGLIISADEEPPRTANDFCYTLDETSSLAECGGGSSCWVYRLSADCE